MPGAFELQPLARHEYRLTLPGEVRFETDQYALVETGDLLYRFRSPHWLELQQAILASEQDIASASADIDVELARIAEAELRLRLMRERLSSLSGADIRNAELEANAAEIEASLPRLRAELKQAETKHANAQRTRDLAVQRASAAVGIPAKQLAEEVEIDGSAVRAYLTVDWIEVRATEPGIVESLSLTDGSYADSTTLVLTTIDPAKVRFRALALQSDIGRLGLTHEARIVPPSSRGMSINDGVTAKITIGLEAHPEQRTMTILAYPAEAREWIRPGVSAFLEIVAETTGGPALAIPRTAVVQDGLTHVLFRRDPQDPNKAIRVEADMGVDDGRWVVINSGISLSDEVVLGGAYELKLATQQSGTAQKGGHFHADGTFHADH
ncbi:MAG: efflux RND transporter periplasmic adaptor subunit [Phycisphaerales bacterium]